MPPGGTFDVPGRITRAAELRAEAAAPDLWSDTNRGQAVTRELAGLEADLAFFHRVEQELEDAEVLLDLAAEHDDFGTRTEAENLLSAAERDIGQLEVRSLYIGEYDERDAIVTISAGAGGVDAQDWAEMLLRMYLRWCDNAGWKVDLDDAQDGEEAGIRGATFTVHGRYAYGRFVAERGVHRLVRMSPFDAQSRRQTSFASVDVIPVVEEKAVEIREEDLRIDTYRSQGAGGQHVNVTDSAVRITHLPTGVVVSCQNERSQMQNRAKAMQILAARLADRARAERRQELDDIRGEKTDIAWGHQIRSYVLAPYQLVKDLRTESETGNVQAVLNGDLDDFVDAWLRWRRSNQE